MESVKDSLIEYTCTVGVVPFCWLHYISWLVWVIILRELAGRVSADGARHRVSFIIAWFSMLPGTLSQIWFLKINLFIWTHWQVLPWDSYIIKDIAINLLKLWFYSFWLGGREPERVINGDNWVFKKIVSCFTGVWLYLHLDILGILMYLFHTFLILAATAKHYKNARAQKHIEHTRYTLKFHWFLEY